MYTYVVYRVCIDARGEKQEEKEAVIMRRGARAWCVLWTFLLVGPINKTQPYT